MLNRIILKDMSKYIPAQVVPGIVGFISIPIITRLFTPANYGDYVIVVSTVSVLVMLVGWLPMSIIRFYPEYVRKNRLALLKDSLLIMMIISVLCLACIYAFGLFSLKKNLSASMYSLLKIGIVFFALHACFEMLLEFLRAQRKIGWYSLFSAWKSITSIGFGLLLVIACSFNIEGLLWGAVICFSIALPVQWRLLFKKTTCNLKNFSKTAVKEAALYGFPLVAGNLAALILSISDRYILAALRGSIEVGIYSASYGISEKSIMLIATLFAATSGSIIYNVWEQDGAEKSREVVRTITRYYVLVGVPAVVGLSVLAKPLIHVLTGEAYQQGYKIIPFVVSGAFLLGMQQRFQPGLLLYKKTFFVMISIIIAGVLNIGLNFLLIPPYGFWGAALTTLISYLFLLSLMIVFSRRFFIWDFPFKSLVRVSCASLVMGIVVYYVGNNQFFSDIVTLITGVCTGVLLFFITLVVMGEFTQEELNMFNSLRQRLLIK